MGWLTISAFDLDDTLLKGNCSYRFGRYLYQEKLINTLELLFIFLCKIGFIFKLISLKQLHEAVFSILFKGRPSQPIYHAVSQFIDFHLNQCLNQGTSCQLSQAKEAGHLVIILSSSPSFLVEPIARRLNVQLSKGTEYAIGNDGRFSHISSLMLGQTKADYLTSLAKQYGIAKENIVAYSDSHLDLPFLEAAGTPIAVNPDRKLRLICQRNGWSII